MLLSRTRRAAEDRAGTELARLVLRGALGGTLVAHGIRHGRTLDGTAGWFGSLGFRQPRLQAQLSAVIEAGFGAAAAVGALTPLSASAIVGTMGVAYRTVHRPNGYFVVAEGWEYVGFLAATSVALSALGPGRFSVDHLVGVDRVGTPAARAAMTALLGVAGTAAQLRAFWRPAAS